MSDEKNESVYPIANWDMGPIVEHGVIVFRPHYITSPGQSLEEAQISRYYAMTLSQAQELKGALENAIAMLESQQGE